MMNMILKHAFRYPPTAFTITSQNTFHMCLTLDGVYFKTVSLIFCRSATKKYANMIVKIDNTSPSITEPARELIVFIGLSVNEFKNFKI